jgi:hypothetical protein
MLSFLWKIIRVVLVALAIFAGLVVGVSVVMCWPHSPLLLLGFASLDLIGTVPSVLLAGVPAYLLMERLRIPGRKVIAGFAAAGLSGVAAWLSMPVMHQCLFSYDARSGLAMRLSSEEASTIKCLPVMFEESCFCPHWFQFQRNGRMVAVGAYEDRIHGTKYRFDDSP